MFEQNSLPLFTIWLIVCWTCMLPGQYCRYLQYPTLTESWNIRIVWFIESPTPTRCFDNKHWYTPANQRHWISLSNWIEFLNKCVLTKDCLLEAAILDDLTSPVRMRGRCSRRFLFRDKHALSYGRMHLLICVDVVNLRIPWAHQSILCRLYDQSAQSQFCANPKCCITKHLFRWELLSSNCQKYWTLARM